MALYNVYVALIAWVRVQSGRDSTIHPTRSGLGGKYNLQALLGGIYGLWIDCLLVVQVVLTSD